MIDYEDDSFDQKGNLNEYQNRRVTNKNLTIILGFRRPIYNRRRHPCRGYNTRRCLDCNIFFLRQARACLTTNRFLQPIFRNKHSRNHQRK
jgi:hypothetical protein